MKRTKLALAGIAILACVLILLAHDADNCHLQHNTILQQDSTQQTNSNADVPVITIGIPVIF